MAAEYLERDYNLDTAAARIAILIAKDPTEPQSLDSRLAQRFGEGRVSSQADVNSVLTETERGFLEEAQLAVDGIYNAALAHEHRIVRSNRRTAAVL